MGSRGPTPTDPKVLKLRGTFRGDRHASAPVAPAGTPLAELPRAPKSFDGVAVAVWQRAGGELLAKGLLTAGALDMLAAYCLAVSRAVAEEKKVQEMGGATYITKTGYERIRPGVTVAQNAWAEARQFATVLGLTPAAAARLGGAGEEQPPADPDEDFMFGAKSG